MKVSQNRALLTLVAGISCLSLEAFRAEATQVVLSQDSMTSAASGQTATNFNTGTNALSLLIDGRAGNIRKSWLQFDLNSILPVGTTWSQVSRATLTVYVRAVTASGTVRVEGVKGVWTEGALTNASAPLTGNDPTGNVYATANITTAGKYVTFDVTELVKDWMDGSVANNGLALVPADAVVQVALDSKEATASSHPAVLEVTLAGVAGINGAAWLSGSVVPATTIGAVGDFYINTATSTYYGPKTAAGWGTGILLKGASGTNGATWLSGIVAPVTTQGVVGDFYINSTTSTYYGPKTALGWGTGIVLKGTAGTNGTNGVNGTNGINGTNGATWLSGTVVPVSTQGVLGDFYINTATSTYYGPKTALGWGIGIVLKGTAGTNGVNGVNGTNGINGTNGATWLSGTVVPIGTQGVLGDFYINTATSTYYGPKTALGWGAGVVLKGTAGTNGANGVNGTNGINGTNGATWLSGTVVPVATQGVLGDFYINTATSTYYGPKTALGWGSGVVLKGATGAVGLTGGTGATGPQGPIGLTGATGLQGPIGLTGANGSQGPIGLTGGTGATGLQGPIGLTGGSGATGPAGVNGVTWLSGTVVPVLTQGVVGDFYLNTATSTYYGPKTTLGWGSGVVLKGATGAQGPTGLKGDTGSIGPIGFTGPQGVKGDTGNVGPIGLTGSAGAPGAVGPQGPAGVDGKSWYSGNGIPPVGIGSGGDFYLDLQTYVFYGPKTTEGWGSGVGLKSVAGVGEQGSVGPSGATGPKGDAGIAGAVGPQGPIGPSGAPGFKGDKGDVGPQGPAGVNGQDGLNGRTWLTGTGTPDAALGILGDLYFDVSAGAYYGPKDVSGWGNGVSLRGAVGAQGPVGLTGASGLHASFGAPDDSIGGKGDIYFDVSAGAYYGPKTDDGWGIPVTVIGQSGPAGPAGGAGPAGEVGPAGPAGATAVRILPMGDVSMGSFTNGTPPAGNN